MFFPEPSLSDWKKSQILSWFPKKAKCSTKGRISKSGFNKGRLATLPAEASGEMWEQAVLLLAFIA